MRAARAFAWQFGRSHFFVLAGLAAYIAAFSALAPLFVSPDDPIRLTPPDGRAAFLTVPITFGAFYFVGMFTFGLSGDLAARESIFPRRMFTLPVTSAELAGWPMLYGCSAIASLWLVVALASRVIDTNRFMPWLWPALFAAVVMAWMQALMWMPYGLRGIRVVISVLWLLAIDVVAFVAVNLHATDATIITLLAPQLPIAYVIARYGVARARRGDVPDWTIGRMREPEREASAERSPEGTRPFRSAARAQTWFEWRCHGRTLPALVALVVPVELLLLFIPGNDTAPIVFLVVFVALLTPPFLAVFAAGAMSTATPYMARRPLSSPDLIAAKIKVTVWSTLAAWLLAIIFIGSALMLSRRMPVVVERLRTGSQVTGALRMTAVVAVTLVALVASTWKHLVQSMCIGLTGRDWLIKGSVLLALVALIALWPLVDEILFDMKIQGIVWNALPWILAAMVLMKMIGGAWVAIRLHDRRLLADRALVTGAVCWLAAVLAIYGVLVWFADSPAFPRYFLGAIAILNVPLARVSAAPLALEWSRHR
jgi:hypothetical protein